MATYAYQAFVNLDILDETISASASFTEAAYQGAKASPSEVVVYFENELTAEQEADLQGIVDAHDADGVSSVKVSSNHISFGEEFFDRWNKRFISEGYLEHVLSYQIAEGLVLIRSFVQIGNLYAVEEMLAGAIPEAAFVTAAVIVEMRNEIRDFLGLELL